MEHLENILKLAENELAAVVSAGKFRSREEIDSVYKLIDIVKDINCVWQMEDESGMSYADGSYRYDDASYARGRGRNANRDSMGRYSRNDGRSMRGGSYRGGSYRMDGYSRADFADQLQDMMEDAPDEQSREKIRRMVEEMRNK